MDIRVRPGDLRSRTHVTTLTHAATLVRVRTRRDWNREQFFRWLDDARQRVDPPIPHDGALAERAGISHSTISNWRNGKQRPTTERLALIAQVLGVPARDLWVRAGLMAADEVGLADAEHLTPPPPEDDEESIRLVMRSDAPVDVKEALVREIRRMQREHADERATLAQRMLDLAWRPRKRGLASEG